jgi:quinolinate synthase
MIRFVKESPAQHFIVATEVGMIHPLRKVRPDAEFVPAGSRGVCPNMKKTTLEKVLASLAHLQFQVEVPEEIRRRAERSLQRMVEVLPEK